MQNQVYGEYINVYTDEFGNPIQFVDQGYGNNQEYGVDLGYQTNHSHWNNFGNFNAPVQQARQQVNFEHYSKFHYKSKLIMI